jgi:hypothetical protein
MTDREILDIQEKEKVKEITPDTNAHTNHVTKEKREKANATATVATAVVLVPFTTENRERPI